MVDIQREKYLSFVRLLPALVKQHLKIDVTIDYRASIVEGTGKRYVSVSECEIRGLTYAFTVVASTPHPYTVMQVPLMLEDGTFVVKGKRRVVMLLRKRARVPVELSPGIIAVDGGKLDVARRQFTPSYGVKHVSVDKATKVGTDSNMLRLICDKGTSFTFDPNDVVNMRIWTVDRLMCMLIEHLLKTTKVKDRWPEQYITVAIFSAFASGNWRGMPLNGVTQLANMNNSTSLRAQLTSVVSSFTSVSARYVHPSTCKYFCVSQTPEGQKVGLVHRLVEGVQVSDASDTPEPVAGGDMPWFHNGKLQREKTARPDGPHQELLGTIWTWSDAGRMSAGDYMLGHTARHIPFMNHNQGPRISYYCSMAKQAMGSMPVANAHQLLYAQRPLVGPCHAETEGCNVILAVNCMGFNQEDALVVSKGALERGLFRSIQWNTYTANTDNLDHLAVGQQIPAGAEILPHTFTAKRGAPLTTVTEAAEADGIARVTTGALRMPVRGDKMCSRHGQKGVIGMIVPDEDMPFTQEGIRPDFVINAHAFPSRMTVGQIMEMAGGKVSGHVDGTPFSGTSLQELYARGGSGRETMYSGSTGLPLPEKIFIAPCWYQRLCHFAQEKCYARGSTGLTDRLTNQPTAGRKNAGGMRLGEMERDVLLGSGATQVLRERMDCIGSSSWDTCSICNRHICQHIFAARTTPALTVPHATTLLATELAAMGIEMSLHAENSQ